MSEEQERAAERDALIQQNKGHYDAIDFSLEVQAFLGGRIGQHLIQCAELEREEAVRLLIDCTPSSCMEISQLQNTIKRAESIQLWLANIIQEGDTAQEQLLNQDQVANSGGHDQ